MRKKAILAAMALALAATVVASNGALAIDPRLSDAIGRGSRQQGIGNAIGTANQIGQAAGRAGRAAHNSTQWIPKSSSYGCYKLFGC